MKRPVLTSAIVTVVCLIGGMFIGVAIIPREQNIDFLVSISIFGGGALWASLLARIHNFPNRKGVFLAGGLSFWLAVLGAINLLRVLERVLVGQHRLPGVPVHNIFALLFVPATFLVATIGSSAILIVSSNRARWFPSALATGAAAALSFLIVDQVLDALGLRVGAPRAAERATMLTVAFLSLAAAAFSAGAILGRFLSKGAGRTPPAA